MDAVTYPNQKVIDFIQTTLIPLQLLSNAEPYAGDYGVKWTPNLLIIDDEGKVYQRAVGFHPACRIHSMVAPGHRKSLV